MSHLAIFVLGPLRIEMDGQPIQTSRHKALALLVYLVMHPEKQPRELLSALLWSEYEQDKAFAYLRRALWELNSMLGEGWLEANREEIKFSRQADIFLDSAEFQAHLTAFRQHSHPKTEVCQECLAHLHTAAMLYRGDFLAGFNLRNSPGFEDWQFFQGDEFRQAYANALQRLANLLYQEHSFQEAAVFAQRWLSLDTLNEEAHRLLMKLFDRTGQRHLAIRQYQECQRVLHAELGVTPEPATRAFYEAIISDEFNSKPETPSEWIKIDQSTPGSGRNIQLLDEVTSAKGSVPATNLTPPETDFVGRENEICHISTLLSDPDCWLLTLHGPGGIGKTRLALEVGRRYSAQFPRGVCFVSLSMVETERSIAPAMARSLGLVFRQNGPPPEDQLLDFLSKKDLLLILDSFEQLVPWAGWLEKIHAHAPAVKLLVTSRHRLLLQGERVLEVKGLYYPRDQAEVTPISPQDAFRRYSALELFLQTARRSQAIFEPSGQDLAAIIQIAQLLEGMPLGLELAATWLNTLTCQEIAVEITRSLDILESTLVNITERQRSMRAVFDQSWKLLSRREQTILPRLAIFRGSFTRQAAEQIAGISLRELSGLVDKSLVQRTPSGRFMLHDLLRQYCAEILSLLPADNQETSARHCAYFCARLSQWNLGFASGSPGQVLREMDTDLENARAAWEWAASQGQIGRLEQATDGLCLYFLRRARFLDGLTLCQRAETALREVVTPESRVEQACLLIWQAVLCMNMERIQDAEQFLEASQSILDQLKLDGGEAVKEQVFLLTIRGEIAVIQNNPSSGLYFEQLLNLVRKPGMAPRWAVFYWRFLMGSGTATDKIYSVMEEILVELRRLEDPFEIGCTLFTLGILDAYWYYRMDRAEPLLRESHAIFQVLDDPVSQVMTCKAMGYLLSLQGKFIEDLALKEHELVINQELGDPRMIGICHAETGEDLSHLGKYPEAEVQIRMGMNLLKTRAEPDHALRQRILGDIVLAQGKYAEAREAYQVSLHFFQSAGEKTWTFAALTALGRAEWALGDRSSAWTYVGQAWQLYREGKVFVHFSYQLLALYAFLLADKGDINRALELYGLATTHPNLAYSQWYADVYWRFIEERAAVLPPQERAAAVERGRALDFSATMESLTTAD
jgi:predicted ATPase/DNA-binding SARP family transcriptional activator